MKLPRFRVPRAAYRVPRAGCRMLGAVLGAACWVLGVAAAQQGVQPGQMPSLPLTQLDERTPSAEVDNRAFSLTFTQPVAIRDLLLLLVRGTGLSLAPDPSISGTFIGELKNVTIRQALNLILPPLGLDYRIDGSFIRVVKREPETRIFDINYIATARTGTATISSGSPAGGSSSTASVSSSTSADVFADLAKGVQALLSDRALFNVDRKAGLVQVTDWPDRLDRVEVYLDAVAHRVQRQAQIEARVIEVELNDETATGIDWAAVAADQLGGPAAADRSAARPALAGLRVTDVDKLMSALAAQGKVITVASPRLVSLNNEPAIVRTENAAISVTPQIGDDGVLTLSLSPIVRAPAIAESDLIARVADGETLVIWGLTRDREVRERRAVGRTGGWFGRSTVVVNKKIEMVIMLTPRVVP